MRQASVKGHGTIRARESSIRRSAGTVVEALELRRMLAGNAPLLSDVFVTPGAYEGDVVTAVGTVIDFDTTDSHTLTLDWNDPNSPAAVYSIGEVATLSEGQVINSTTDGSPLTILALDAESGLFVFSADHIYADDGVAPGNGTFADTAGIDITVADSGGESATMPTILNAVTGFQSGAPAFDTDTSPTFAPVLTDQLLISGGFAIAGTSDTAYTIEVHDVASDTWVPVYSDTVVADTEIEFNNTNINFPAVTIDQIRLTIDSAEGGTFVFEDPSITIGHTVQVFNLAPTLTNVDVTDADQNAPVTLSGDVLDVGSLDELTVQINWGDPSSPGNIQTLTLPAGSTGFSVNHVYANVGTYDISVSLVDDDGGIAPGAPTGTVLAGPSALGYVATEADFEAINLQDGINGAFTVLDNTDDGAASLNLGAHSFNYYGTNYSAITVGANGVIQLGNGLISPLGYDFTTSNDAADRVLAQYRDTDNNGVVDQLVIEWSEVRPFTGSPSSVTFQAVLQLNTPAAGDIVFNYVDLNAGNADSRKGAVSIAGGEPIETLGLPNAGANPYINSGTAIRFSVNQITTVSTTISEVIITNTPPVADAGDDYIGNEGTSISLDGTGSSDAEQNASTLSYVWSVTDAGNTVVLSGVGATLNFTPADNGVYTATLTVTDSGLLVSADSATITVANVAPVVNVDVPSQTVDAGEAIAPVTITASDVAADAISASVADLPSGLTFAQTAPGVWTITGSAAAGSYTATVSVSDEDGGLTTTSVSFTVNAVVAAASAEYTGTTLANTASFTTNTATVNLRASVLASTGDVRDAVVTFYLYDVDTNALVATVNGGAVSLLNTADTSTGTSSAAWTADIGTSNSQTFRVVVGVTGAYAGESDSELILVARPDNKTAISMSGHTINDGSGAGILAGTSGEKTNYSINVRYKHGGIDGSVAMLIRRLESDGIVHTYSVSADSILSFATNSATGEGVVTAYVTVTDVTNKKNPVVIATNVLLQITVTDAGRPDRGNSTVGATLWQSNGTLLFSNSWDGYESIEEALAAGKVKVV